MAGGVKRVASVVTRRVGNFYHLNFLGLAFGLYGYFLALTPTLMPRNAFYLGLIAGLGFAIGYGIGVLVSYIWRWLRVPEPTPAIKSQTWRTALPLFAMLIITFGFEAASWQNEVRLLVGEEPLDGASIGNVVWVSFVTLTVVLLVSRLIRGLTHIIKRQVAKVRILPRKLVTLLSVGIVSALLVMVFNGVFVDSFKDFANKTYSTANDRDKPGVEPVTSSLRSGGPDSAVSWHSLGREGRSFVATGPSQADIAEFTGREAAEPIRVYAGYLSAETLQERAALAVEELERTGAFDRQILVVMTATGSGWIEPQTADALEYMWGGDSALVTIQYSYLPSWMSLIFNQKDATDAGRLLFEAVYERWSQLPEDERPKLIAYGLSLGSFGSQAAFSSASDYLQRTDGALYAGTPSFAEPWKRFTTDRDSGSPQILPVYQDGQTLRFAATIDDIMSTEPGPWGQPRVLYLQHPSDPVVWWNPDLILQKPDWLSETRGYDVSPRMQWYPFITFIQVTIDQFFGVDVPNGHGHNYPPTIVNAWRAVTQPDNWTDAENAKLQELINQYERS